jgi:putative ABC transport system permease protein
MRDFREQVRRRLAGVPLDPAREAEIVEEIALHLDDRYIDLMTRGATADQAAAAALAELDESDVLAGHLAQVEARVLEPIAPGAPRGRNLAGDLWRDLRYAARALKSSPSFTLVTLLSLALGIGANTAIFQLLDAIHLRNLPVRSPDELVTVRVADRQWARGNFNSWHPDLTHPIWERLKSEQEAFSGIAAWGDVNVNLAPRGEARWARGFLVSGDFFDVLGVRPMLGRLLGAEDDRPGCATAGVVVSHGFWKRELGGDPAAVGRKLSLDGHTVSIVGVTPPEFFGPEVGRTFDVALPLCMESTLLSQGQSRLGIKHWWWLSAIGRLAPGWTIDEASAHLASLSPGMMEATVPEGDLYTADDVARFRAYRLAAYPAANGISDLRERYTTPLYFLLATAALVLLIACANLANLLLARATAREREIAVRLAIGASRGRLLRQLMTESLLLAALGAALAMLLARGLTEFLIAFLSTRDRALTVELDPDVRVLAFTAGLAALTCILFGLVPALHAARTDVALVLKTHSLSAGGGRLRLRRALVVVQVALSFVLLVGALLFARSFRNLVTVEAGFRSDGLVVLGVDLRPLGLADERLRPLQRQLLARVRAAPAVDEAVSTAIVPVSGDSWDNSVWIDGQEPRKEVFAFFNRVSPGYFRALGSSLLAGRDFGAGDTFESPRVAIVSQSFARDLTGGENPIGRRFRVAAGVGEPETVHEIVGLVPDSRYRRLRDEIRPLVYLPAGQEPRPDPWATLLVRSSAPLSDVAASLEQAVAEVAPPAILEYALLDDEIRETLVRERLMATLSGFFGVLAALLAGIGLYGVIAYSVARRTHEIGIRMALGAERRQISAMFLREAIRLLVAGLAAGLVLSLAATRAAGALLYGLAPHDPWTLVLAGALMAAITFLASLLPAWRAAAVDPMVALRQE